MADLLVARLLETDRVIVLERQHLGDVVGEITRQGRDLFRREGRVERGRLKNARYLIRGSVTDFGVIGGAGAGVGMSRFRLFGRGSHARVAISLKVSDVETGEILCAVKAEGLASEGEVGAEARYKGMAFGGDAFFRTPLGRATERAIASAVDRILRGLPRLYWQPRVVNVEPDGVVINGGRNYRVRVGDVFVVRDAPRVLTDPETGNPLETVAGPRIGWLRVTAVREQSARAALLEGRAERGHCLERRRRAEAPDLIPAGGET